MPLDQMSSTRTRIKTFRKKKKPRIKTGLFFNCLKLQAGNFLIIERQSELLNIDNRVLTQEVTYKHLKSTLK